MGKSAKFAGEDLAQKLSEVNASLERVKLRVKGDRFYVRGSQFPPKPGAETVERHEIATGCATTPTGLRTAKAIAQEIDSKLILHTFRWDPYLKAKHKPAETIGDWIERLEVDHWTRTPRNPDKENTFTKCYTDVYRSLPKDASLSFGLLKEILLRHTKPETRKRQSYAIAFARLIEFAQIEGGDKLRQLGKGYNSSSVNPKDLPSDERILEIYHSIDHPGWKWVYGMLATYGLRNHEVFFLDISGINGELGTIQVTEGKTGDRIVYPCSGKGWDMDLTHQILPNIKWRELAHNKVGNRVSHWFCVHQVGITAYSLRHSYARRMFEQGHASRLAAKSMGHSPKIHEQVYSAWWSQEAYDKVFREVRDRQRD